MDSNLFTLSTALKTAIKSPVLTELHHFRMIQKYWGLIMGSEHLAEVITPFKLSQKTLFVLVADAAYSEHFSYYIEKLIALIASEPICGEGKVTKVRFRVGSMPEKPTLSIVPKPAKTTVILNTDTLKQVEETASSIKDHDVRDSFTRWMKKIKERKKTED